LAEIKNRIIGSGEEPLDSILFNPRNWRIHPLNQQNALKGVLEEVGWVQQVIVNKRTGNLIDGHLRCQLAAREGNTTIPVVYVDVSEEEEALILSTLDPIAGMAATDKAKLDELLAGLETENQDVQNLLNDIAEKERLEYGKTSEQMALDQAHKTLAERFIVPPFSILDARQGYWQTRKSAWITLGIKSEIGRGGQFNFPDDHIGADGKFHAGDLHLGDNRDANGNTVRPFSGALKDSNQFPDTLASKRMYDNKDNGLLGFSEQARSHYKNASPGGSPRPAATLSADGHTVRGDGKGRELATSSSSQARLTALQKTGNSSAEDFGTEGNISEQTGTSIFDPVLCELVYRWFMPSNGHVLDPFAGGSVRGIVASMLGHSYTGIDLSARQLDANRIQADELLTDNKPNWIVGDSKHVTELAPGEYDLIFSCPPYADLEVYSDDPNDLSNMAYPDFKSVYHEIIYSAVSMLKDNRFACFVVGDVRDKKGFYRNFPAHTIEAFQDAGMTLYNEAILVTAVGSLPIRVGRQFGSYRKLGKTHQNVLVFYKGDVADIKTWGEVECGVPDKSEHIEQL